jgi:hypothetical protein
MVTRLPVDETSVILLEAGCWMLAHDAKKREVSDISYRYER